MNGLHECILPVVPRKTKIQKQREDDGRNHTHTHDNTRTARHTENVHIDLLSIHVEESCVLPQPVGRGDASSHERLCACVLKLARTPTKKYPPKNLRRKEYMYKTEASLMDPYETATAAPTTRNGLSIPFPLQAEPRNCSTQTRGPKARARMRIKMTL